MLKSLHVNARCEKAYFASKYVDYGLETFQFTVFAQRQSLKFQIIETVHQILNELYLKHVLNLTYLPNLR